MSTELDHLMYTAAERKAAEQRSAERKVAHESAASELLLELALHGFTLGEVAELRNLKDSRAAQAIIQDRLPGITHQFLHDECVRCLSSRRALPVLLSEFTRGDIDNWTIGNQLYRLMRNSQKDFAACRDLVVERTYGVGRQMLVLKLGVMRTAPGAAELLLGLLDDRDVVLHAIMALGRLRAKSARNRLKHFVDVEWLEQYWQEQKGSGQKKDVLGALRREANKSLLMIG